MADKITYVNEFNDGSSKRILLNGQNIGAIAKRGSGCWFGYLGTRLEVMDTTKKETVEKIVELYKQSLEASSKNK